MIKAFYKNKFISVVVPFVFLLCALHSLQRMHDSRYPDHQSPLEDFKYLPNSNFVKGCALSFNEVLADLLWIKAVGYFGDHFSAKDDYRWLFQLLDVTTTLDPYYDDPYEFGGIVLANVANDVDASFKILERGMENVPKHHPRYWYLPFFTAFNHMYYRGDYQRAAHYLEIAASFPQRPAYLPLLVARLYANTDDPGVAIPFLEKMIERAATPEMREKLEQRIKEVRVRQDIKNLTKARDIYKEKAGRYPVTLGELVEDGIIPSLPKEPFGGRYYIRPGDYEIFTTSDIDTMKLHIHKNKSSL